MKEEKINLKNNINIYHSIKKVMLLKGKTT